MARTKPKRRTTRPRAGRRAVRDALRSAAVALAVMAAGVWAGGPPPATRRAIRATGDGLIDRLVAAASPSRVKGLPPRPSHFH